MPPAEPLRQIELALDPALGPALWASEVTGPRTARMLDDLSPAVAACPPPLAAALSTLVGPLRHRSAPDAGGRRRPVRPVDGAELVAVLEGLDSAIQQLRTRGGTPVAELLEDLAAEHSSLRLTDSLVIKAQLLAAVLTQGRAQETVAERRVLPVLEERFDRTWARWSALDPSGRAIEDPLLQILADACARTELADVLAQGPKAPEDPVGLLAALGPEAAALEADLPASRRITAGMRGFLASAREGVRLHSREAQLVVRLHEPPLGSAWPLQTCLREADGTVHPVADLRAVGDLSAAEAAQAAGAIMREAPTVRTAMLDETGVDWLLTTEQASAFLSIDSPGLEDAGITVMLPRDWTRVRTRVRAEVVDPEATTDEPTAPAVGLAAMMSFRWKLAVGDTELTDEEIAQIREAQSELVHLRGQWVRLDQGTLRAAERFLDAFAGRARAGGGQAMSGQGTSGRAAPPHIRPLPGSQQGEVGVGPGERAEASTVSSGELSLAEFFALLGSEEAAGTEIDELTIHGRMSALLQEQAAAPSLPAPSTLRAQLRPYQRRGLDWMWFLTNQQLGGILADDMGLGKTMQILALLCREREQAAASGDRIGPTLLVCPMSVVGSWQREAQTFAPDLAVHVHHGGDRVRDDSFAEGIADMDLVITTYSLLARDLPLLSRAPWHRVVLDEAQHIKNPQTAVSQAARALPARHRLALTGTPVENRLADLHSLMDFANPGMLGTRQRFADTFATPIETEADESAVSRLARLTGPFVLRRVKTDRAIIADLPAKTEITQRVNLTPEQAGLYEALVQEMLASIDGADRNQRRALVVSTITRLKQVCNHPAHYLQDGSGVLREGAHRSGKLELVDDILESAFADGEKVLLFTQFTALGDLVLPYWTERFGQDIPFLHGGLPKAERDAMVADFQARTDSPGAMLLSLRAGGTGLTLTAANHVVHLDRWWNPAVENQATDRAFRIGQRRNVQVRKLVSAGTVEERIDQVLADKKGLADLAVGSGEGWLSTLEDDELAALLALDADQVGGHPEAPDAQRREQIRMRGDHRPGHAPGSSGGWRR